MGPPSHFALWAAERIRTLPSPQLLLDLGSGPGRDARFLARFVARVRAIDHSRLAVTRARGQKDNPAHLEFEEADVLAALRSTDASSVDAVYAHGLYMLLSPIEVGEVAREVARVLRHGGLHLFAVRSTTDPKFGHGHEVAPDTWVHPPNPEPIHYYRRESLERFTRRRFRRVAEELAADLHLWFVCDLRP